jgi:hypothetical protein
VVLGKARHWDSSWQGKYFPFLFFGFNSHSQTAPNFFPLVVPVLGVDFLLRDPRLELVFLGYVVRVSDLLAELFTRYRFPQILRVEFLLFFLALEK